VLGVCSARARRVLGVCSVPQQLGFALQAVQQLDLAVHAGDLVLQVLAGHVHLLAELHKHTRQLPEETHTALREDREVLVHGAA